MTALDRNGAWAARFFRKLQIPSSKLKKKFDAPTTKVLAFMLGLSV
jgi:hypothetical protein